MNRRIDEPLLPSYYHDPDHLFIWPVSLLDSIPVVEANNEILRIALWSQLNDID
jgi:hypothetical protein